jgi:hypothetical protein
MSIFHVKLGKINSPWHWIIAVFYCIAKLQRILFVEQIFQANGQQTIFEYLFADCSVDDQIIIQSFRIHRHNRVSVIVCVIIGAVRGVLTRNTEPEVPW